MNIPNVRIDSSERARFENIPLLSKIEKFKGRKIKEITVSASHEKYPGFSKTIEVSSKIEWKEIKAQRRADIKYVPLSLKEKPVSQKDIVFIPLEVFTKTLGLGDHFLNKAKNLTAEASDVNLAAIQVRNQVVRKLENEGIKFLRLSTLKERLDIPVENEVKRAADEFYFKSAKSQNFAFSDLWHLKRMDASDSLKMGEKRLAENWQEADFLIKERALIKKPLDEEFFIHLHKVLQKENRDPDVIPGKYREADEEVNVGGIGGMGYAFGRDVELLMKDTFSWLQGKIEACEKQQENPIIIAASLHQRIASIHPFADGNGRTARLAADYVLQRFGLPSALYNFKDFAVFGFQGSESRDIKLLGQNTLSYAVQGTLNALKNSYLEIK